MSLCNDHIWAQSRVRSVLHHFQMAFYGACSGCKWRAHGVLARSKALDVSLSASLPACLPAEPNSTIAKGLREIGRREIPVQITTLSRPNRYEVDYTDVAFEVVSS